MKYTIKAIAAVKGLTIMELEEKCGVQKYHFASVQNGRAKMTATDLIKLCDFTGLNMHDIETDYKED